MNTGSTQEVFAEDAVLLIAEATVIVATGEKALEKVERELGRAGLLIPARVQLCMGA